MRTHSFIAAILVALFGLPINAGAAIQTFVFSLDGAQEFPGPGDPDGTGTATLMIDDVANTIDWNFSVSNIALPLTGAHIHEAAVGVAGPVRVDFSAALSGSGLFDADLVNVLANPSGFYVNLHNSDFSAGAIRGQLPAAPIPAPPALILLGSALGAALLRIRRASRLVAADR